MNNDFKSRVDTRLSSLALSGEIKQAIRAGAAPAFAAPPPVKKRRRLRRTLITAIAACLALVFGVAAAASAFPAFETFIAHMGEDFRNMVQPLNEECVSNGIRMQVVAAVNDSDTSIVYLTLQDLEQNRIDSTTEIFDSNLDSSWVNFATMVHFDAETRTATYRLEGLGTDEHASEKITLSIRSFLSGQSQLFQMDTGLMVADIIAANPTPELVSAPQVGGIGVAHGVNVQINDEFTAMFDLADIPVLTPGTAPIALPNANAPLTIGNAGLVDGFLHIQHNPQGLQQFNHVTPVLLYPGAASHLNNSPQLAVASVDFGNVTELGANTLYEYTEYIMELPQDVPLEEISLGVDGYTYESYTEGNWSVTFMLDENLPARRGNCSVSGEDWQIDQVAVSQIGVAAYGHGEMNDPDDYLDIALTTTDGTQVDFLSFSHQYNEDGTFEIKYNFARPVNPESIVQLTLNGQPVELSAV